MKWRAENPRPEEPACAGHKSAAVQSLLRGMTWQTQRIMRWKRSAHINLLEGASERLLLKDLSRRRMSGRLNVVEDSRVTILSGAKGRSSSDGVRCQLSLSLPWHLSGGFFVGRHYGPTRLMPADHPTRGRPVPPPQCAPPPWVHASSVSDPLLAAWMLPHRLPRAWADWARLVLLYLGGDVERHPGPSSCWQRVMLLMLIAATRCTAPRAPRASSRPPLPQTRRLVTDRTVQIRAGLVENLRSWLSLHGKPTVEVLLRDADDLVDAPGALPKRSPLARLRRDPERAG